MPVPQVFDVDQDCTHRYTATIKDETGAAIAAASLTTLTLTLFDLNTNTIINSRSAQNCLNANGVTVDSSGNLVWTGVGGSGGDNQILNASRNGERHRALFQFTWNTGAKYGTHEFDINVRKVANVPSYPSPGP